MLEHRAPEAPELRRYLSELPLPKHFGRDKPAGKASEMRMNGLRFNKGIGAGPSSRLDLQLGGNWRLLRADLGVDDSCRSVGKGGSMRFQVWSGERLLYDSGQVAAPAVVKPEIDVRGLKELSLRTLGERSSRTCGNWANAALIGTEGATLKLR